MKLYSTILSYIATASSSATLYPAINMSYEQVRQPWRSTDTTTQTIVFDLISQVSPKAILLQDCNFVNYTVETSTDDISWSTAVSHVNYADTSGRYKSIAALSGTFRYIRVIIASQATTDNAAYYSIGATYVFSTVTSAPTNPGYGVSITVTYPQTKTDLPNGKTITIDIGAKYSEVSGAWPSDFTQDSAQSIRQAMAGIVALDMEMVNALWMVWPLKVFDGKINRTIQDYSVWPTNFNFKEVV